MVVNPYVFSNNYLQLREVNEASLDQLEKAMYEAGLSSSSGPMSIQSATTVYIGTDKTLTTANAGNCGWSGSGLGTHGEGFSALDSPQWADAGVYLTGEGNIGSWAWIGNTISVQGTQAQYATIDFGGDYNGSILCLTPYSTGGMRIVVSVEDLNTGTVVGSYTVKSTSGIRSATYDASINNSVKVKLYPNHIYALRIGVNATVVSTVSPTQAQSVFCNTNGLGGWTPGLGGEGIEYSSISIDWN